MREKHALAAGTQSVTTTRATALRRAAARRAAAAMAGTAAVICPALGGSPAA